jgi:hypothetical protein
MTKPLTPEEVNKIEVCCPLLGPEAAEVCRGLIAALRGQSGTKDGALFET